MVSHHSENKIQTFYLALQSCMYSGPPILPRAMLHNSRSHGSHTKEAFISRPSSVLLSVGLDTLSGKFPVWSPTEADGPSSPSVWFRCPDWWCHIHHTLQRAWQGLWLTYLRPLGRAGWASQAGLKWLERAREGDWPGFLLWLRSGAGVARIGPCLVWISRQHQRKRHPAFLISRPGVGTR